MWNVSAISCVHARSLTMTVYRGSWMRGQSGLHDSDVRAAVGSYDIFDPSLPTLPVLEPGKLVMEVKFTEMLPQIVRDLLPPNAQEFTAVSKYVLCYEKSQYLHGFEYWNETQERKLL